MRNALFAAVAALSLAAPANAYTIFIDQLNTGAHTASNGQLSFFSSGDVFDGTNLLLNEGDTFSISERIFQPGWDPDFASLALNFIRFFQESNVTVNATFRDFDGPPQTFSYPANGQSRINTPGAPSFNGAVTFSVTGGSVQFQQVDFNVVPEPATWAMLLLGFGFVGATARLRSRQPAASLLQ